AESSVVVDRLLSQYPKTRWASEALYALATYLNKQDRDAEAATRYRQLVSLYPKSQYAPEASYNLGWFAYQSKNYADAARILEQHLASYRYPETKYIGEAGLWAAKSEERLGHKARALALYDLVNARYRYGYHGYVAGLRAAALRKAEPGVASEQAKQGSDLERINANVMYVEKIQETADGSETSRIAKANDLEVIGLGELAVRELNKALEAAPDSPRINLRLAQLYSRRGENFQATLVLRKGYPDIYSYRESDVPREAWEIFFPLVGWSTIKEEAKRYGIDPYVAAGLIRQESVFSPTAISRAGARGLMQVMPATGQLISKRQGIGTITAADLYNPSLNIKLGMNFLAQMLGQFNRIEYAAAAYNAGPGRAQRWIAERGSMDIEDWIESIPFSETRGYVQGVLRYAANYRRLYKE
ncbi:MAG TPA: transglycosylase SLT domain-containing protein, partial [Blastocatellia bacterium]|nr:transglycosylase SLT domain-containing protein [Blastocatellia bacterium]